MKSKIFVTGAVISIFLSCSALASRNLSSEEVNQLFKQLTSNPKTTWIPAGTIKATQEKYRAPKTMDEQEILNAISKSITEYLNNDQKLELTEKYQKMALDAIPFNVRYMLSNKYTMKTSTILKYDGQRYYLDITVDYRQDSVKLPDELKNNYSTDEFNLDWNGRRILAYDGEKVYTYTPKVNHALVESAPNTMTGSISLLTSGFIPWGYNYFTYEKLTKTESSANEETVDGHLRINLTLTNSNGTELLIALDADKDYAPVSWIINNANSTTVHQYGGYKLVSGSWVPTSIITEKFDAATNRLLEGDYITITEIDGQVPSPESFKVNFNPNTSIEYMYDATKPQLIYYTSNTANTELLLAERKAYMAAESRHKQNCATSALQYAALQLGKDILDDQLSQLVNPEDYMTNMLEMKKYAKSSGFYSKAVKTDIQTLKNLSGCKAILHIPGISHFVLVDHVDDKYVWIIDLSKNKFYYRTDISFIGMDWTEGTTLLISDKPISLPTEAVEIPDDQLTGYKGGTGYTCTYRIQSFHVTYCGFDGVNCYGLYTVTLLRYGCELAESGSCPESIYTKKVTYPCVNDPYNPYACNVYAEGKKLYYMWACD